MYSNRGGIFIPPTDQGMNFDEQDPNYFQDQDPNYFQPDQSKMQNNKIKFLS